MRRGLWRSGLLAYVVWNAATALEGEALEPERFLVVTNWFTELRERMGNN